ncbi:MAG: hypothetical protein ACI97A_001546 [Planctomycetota bacterium]|jgi:hypothetical protein
MNQETEATKMHRIFGVFRAPETAALWMILVLLGFFGIWSWIEDKEENAAKRLPQIELKLEATASSLFKVQFAAASSRYVAIYFHEEGNAPQLLFPAFGTPPKLKWPLPAQKRIDLPNDDDFLSLPNKNPAQLFIISSNFGTPNLPFDLWEQEQESDRGMLDGLSFQIFDVNQIEKR